MNLITLKVTIFNRIKVLIEFRDIQIMSLALLDIKASYSAYTVYSGEEMECSLQSQYVISNHIRTKYILQLGFLLLKSQSQNISNKRILNVS